MTFTIGEHINKKTYIHYSKSHFKDLALQNGSCHWTCPNKDKKKMYSYLIVIKSEFIFCNKKLKPLKGIKHLLRMKLTNK